MIIFTTGQMNVIGCPVAPTLKVTGNRCTAQRMADNIDVDVSRMLTGESLVFAGYSAVRTDAVAGERSTDAGGSAR